MHARKQKVRSIVPVVRLKWPTVPHGQNPLPPDKTRITVENSHGGTLFFVGDSELLIMTARACPVKEDKRCDSVWAKGAGWGGS